MTETRYNLDALRYTTRMVDGLYIPRRVTIETMFGCNASCVMCPIDLPTERKKGQMSMPLFTSIIDSLLPYQEYIEMMDLFGLGEPMLDRLIFERIRYVREKGFRNIAISTNAHALTPVRQEQLLESGIETVIFSIDGIRKETHEAIRRRLDFDRVVDHVQGIIRKRDAGNFKTRFVIRFIRQDSNRDEWGAFSEFWNSKISPDKRDYVTAYDVHTAGDGLLTKDTLIQQSCRSDDIEAHACYQIFEILYILADGTVPLCGEDWLHPDYNFGNVQDESAIAVFNSKRFNAMRRAHESGRRPRIPKCSECSLLYSRAAQPVSS